MIRWRLAMRLLLRNWRSGEQRILVAALVIAVAASTAIGSSRRCSWAMTVPRGKAKLTMTSTPTPSFTAAYNMVDSSFRPEPGVRGN